MRQITGFRFVWDQEQKTQDQFDDFVKDVLIKFKVDQTNEIFEVRCKDIDSVISLETPIEIDKSTDYYQPFGDNSNVKCHILDRTVDSGWYFSVTVGLSNFFRQEGTVPTIVILFNGPFFAVSAYDATE